MGVSHDEVIIPDPYFVMYKHLVNLLGGRCVFIDSYPDFDLPVEKIAGAITDKTKLIILNSPSNPTGVVCTDQQIRAMAEIAAEKDILVLTDEIYETFCYDGSCPSIANFYDKSLVLRGFSKSHAMTGWRIGYAAAPAALLDGMHRIHQYLIMSAPTPAQIAALKALEDGQPHAEAMRDEYDRRRKLIVGGLNELGLTTFEPHGAFYAFPSVAASGMSTSGIRARCSSMHRPGD